MLIKRVIENRLKEALLGLKNKVIIIYGPRQAGKTTLIKSLFEPGAKQVLFFTGDDLYAQNLFAKNELEALKRVVENNKILVIDEAQKIDNIGLSIKLIVDHLPVTVLASGSASFDLANKINEPLTGRTATFWLWPLSYQEAAAKYRQTSSQTSLEEMLRFGMFPMAQTIANDTEKQNYLYEYINSYLYKDVLAFEQIKKPKKIIDLLALLALQLGNAVSISELAMNLKINHKTVESYLDILEKMFVIVNLRGFSRNLRKEINKTSKYYFVDLGLRNAIIRNFNPLNLRNDVGAMFENFFIIERMKAISNQGKYANFYFWRTYDQQEIDLIEEAEGKLVGYECKWSAKAVRAPKDWLVTYKNADFKEINQDNFWEYLE